MEHQATELISDPHAQQVGRPETMNILAPDVIEPVALDPIVIVGTGRCGSSALAGMLALLGIFMGRRLVPPDKDNPSGYFEDLEISVLHDGLFYKWLGGEAFGNAVYKLMCYRQHVADARATRWGFKDPRATHLLDFYLEVLNRPYWVHVHRDLGAVIDSMHKTAPYVSRDTIEKLVEGRQAGIEWLLQQNALVLSVPFTELMKDPLNVLLTVCTFCDMQPASEAAAQKAADHIIRRET